MAKKARTPPPPRKVQAPQARKDTGERRARMLMYGVAGAGIVALAAVLAVIFAGGSSGTSSKSVASAMADAGCTFKTVKTTLPKGQPMHVDSLTANIKWNTFPPSSGQHYPTPAVWGFYTKAVNPRMVVHNEEHGGVVLWWGPKVPQATITKLNSFYSDVPESVFGTPIAGLGSKVAISAWTGNVDRYQRNGYYGEGHVAVCPRFDAATKKAFATFRDAYRGKGPEGIPMSANQPGQ
jgi:uncharacterized protein DUF3105